MAAPTPPATPPVPPPPVAGKKAVPPVANQKQPTGLHVPSGVQGAIVKDASAAINQHRMPAQATQTVGTNPNPPATAQSSGQVYKAPLVMPGDQFGTQPYHGLVG